MDMEKLIPKPLADILAVSAAKSKSVESQLPGRERGPADAYRHLLWSAELTRRYGEAKARAMLESKELWGRMTTQPKEEEDMDRHNNEIGIKIGKQAKTFQDIESAAKKIIDTSRNGDEANGTGATWLSKEGWKKHPKDANDKELPEEQWNWGTAIDWENKIVKEPDDYPYGSEKYRYVDSDLTFPEIDWVLPPDKAKNPSVQPDTSHHSGDETSHTLGLPPSTPATVGSPQTPRAMVQNQPAAPMTFAFYDGPMTKEEAYELEEGLANRTLNNDYD